MSWSVCPGANIQASAEAATTHKGRQCFEGREGSREEDRKWGIWRSLASKAWVGLKTQGAQHVDLEVQRTDASDIPKPEVWNMTAQRFKQLGNITKYVRMMSALLATCGNKGDAAHCQRKLQAMPMMRMVIIATYMLRVGLFGHN